VITFVVFFILGTAHDTLISLYEISPGFSTGRKRSKPDSIFRGEKYPIRRLDCNKGLPADFVG